MNLKTNVIKTHIDTLKAIKKHTSVSVLKTEDRHQCRNARVKNKKMIPDAFINKKRNKASVAKMKRQIKGAKFKNY